MAYIELTVENYKDVLQDNEMVFIVFMDATCDLSSKLTPVYEKIIEIHSDIKFAKVITQDAEDLVRKFAIKETPTLAMSKEGIVVYREDGIVLSEDEFNGLISQVKNLDMAPVHAEVAEMEKKKK